MNYIVMCRVSGGVTGTREAPLKQKNGEIRYFDTLEEAQAEAKRLMQPKDSDRYRTADFRYWAEER